MRVQCQFCQKTSVNVHVYYFHVNKGDNAMHPNNGQVQFSNGYNVSEHRGPKLHNYPKSRPYVYLVFKWYLNTGPE